MTFGRSEVKRLLTEAGATPRKSLGQNFVTDPNTLRRIASLAGVGADSQVVEIGAGVGSLTLALAQTGACVLAIETDPKLVGVLEKVAASDRSSPGQITVLHADARTLDWTQTLGASCNPAGHNPASRSWDLVSNLPYNIATSLTLKVLEEAPQVRSLLVMCQREAAERLAADTGDAAYGAVSVLVRMHGQAKLAGAVPATVFWPEPAVESALVSIVRHETKAFSAATETAMRTLLRQTFGRRRKMLRRSLRGGELGIDATTAQDWLATADIDEQARPEQLNFAQWQALGKVASGE